MFALALALSVVGLALGPLLVALGRGQRSIGPLVDGAALALVPGLVGLRLAPHLVEELGAPALALMALGFVGLWLAERRGANADRVGGAVVFPTMLLHSLSDGAGLALAFASGSDGGALLAVAIVLHRLPEGLVLAAHLVPRLGWRATLARIAALAVATFVGGMGGASLLERVPEWLLESFVALGLGALLRLSLHAPHGVDTRSARARALAAAGFLAGLALVFAVPDKDQLLHAAQPTELSLARSVGPLFLETAPSMLLGLVLASLLPLVLKRRLGSWLRGGTAPSQALRGMAFGLPLPLCTCGVLPLVRRLLLGGAPAAAVVAFAIATPELDVGGFVLSTRLLGVPFTVARLVASAAVALFVALLVAWVARETAPLTPAPESEQAGDERPLGLRLRDALFEAVGPTLEHLAAWYVAGLVLAGVFEALVSPTMASRLPEPLDVLASALVAVPVYVCAQGATPLAAIFVHKGFSVGAALAFLIVGPGTNVAVLALVGRALGRRAMLAFALGTVGAAVTAGLVVNRVLPETSLPEVHGLLAHEHSLAEYVAGAVLALLLLRSLFVLGPRAWFRNMSLEPHDHGDAGTHAHDHPHEHEHGHTHERHAHAHGHAHEHEHAHGHAHEPRAATDRSRA